MNFKLKIKNSDPDQLPLGAPKNAQVGAQEFTIDSQDRPSDGVGVEGSILDMALALGIEIDHACGGVEACSTCHVIVREGLESCNASGEREEDMLDQAPGVTGQSRLACQCVPNGTCDIVVEVPSWNRNRVREGN